MFTGIIEYLGEIKEISLEKSNRVFYIQSDAASHLKVDESVSHNGICLTVENVKKNIFRVTAISETLEKTNAGSWNPGDIINLERAMKLNGRLDGHFVQGHVDGTAICINRQDKDGSVEFTFQFDEKFAPLLIEKGSVCINGVSLTAFNVERTRFTVAIIPYTLAHTNFKNLIENDVVNIEYDILGKYLARMVYLKS
jgi:riboflavin synthase